MSLLSPCPTTVPRSVESVSWSCLLSSFLASSDPVFAFLPTAKPFNPMLGETFEYARLDKKFRYVSEQVCHHPVCLVPSTLIGVSPATS